MHFSFINDTNINQRNYASIDLMKFVASLFIVGLHSHIFISFGGKAEYLYQILARFAVPFFFISSSFFFCKKMNAELTANSVITYSKRILKMYLFWFVLYVPLIYYLRLYPLISENENWLYILSSFIRELIFSSTFPGSWYLVASIWCAFILFVCSIRFSAKCILFFSAFIYLLPLFSSAYYGIAILNPLTQNVITKYEEFFSTAYFSWPAGLLYFALGKYFAENESRIIKFSTSFLVKGLFISILIGFIEMGMLGYYHIIRSSDVYFSLIPISVFLFLGILKLKIIGGTGIFVFFRKASTVIYLSHFCFVFLYDIFFTDLQINSFLLYIIIVSLCLTTFFMIKYGEKKYKWLKFAY